MKVAVYSLTRDRLHDTGKSFKLLREMAGIDFDHYVMDNGSTDGTQEWITHQDFHYYNLSLDNKGQCIASNMLLDAIMQKGGYDYIIRFDNDITPKTDGFLAKTIEAMEALGGDVVASPDIIGLKSKPKGFGDKKQGEHKFTFVEILGGACRVAKASLFDNFRFTKHGPLALGEAKQLSAHCLGSTPPIPMVYVKGVIISHPTEDHLAANPEYFQRRKFEEYTPYGL